MISYNLDRANRVRSMDSYVAFELASSVPALHIRAAIQERCPQMTMGDISRSSADKSKTHVQHSIFDKKACIYLHGNAQEVLLALNRSLFQQTCKAFNVR